MDRRVKIPASRRKSGATMVEYIMIVALIAIGVLGAWKVFGGKMTNWLTDLGNTGGTAVADGIKGYPTK